MFPVRWPGRLIRQRILSGGQVGSLGRGSWEGEHAHRRYTYGNERMKTADLYRSAKRGVQAADQADNPSSRSASRPISEVTSLDHSLKEIKTSSNPRLQSLAQILCKFCILIVLFHHSHLSLAFY